MLTGKEINLWTDVFFKAFSPRDFSELLLFRLNDRIESHAPLIDTPKAAMTDVIDAYQRADIEYTLISAAVEARPRNAALFELAHRRQAAISYSDQELQDFVRKNSTYIDLPIWLDKLGSLHVRVCRIEVDADVGNIYGTGFLIAPDLVMTNWHVVRSILPANRSGDSPVGPRATPKNLLCRFDYKRLIGGTINQGNIFGLAEDWAVFTSPNAPDGREPGTNELDIAIVKLNEQVGDLPVGRAGVTGSRRGWIAIPNIVGDRAYRKDAPLAIIQHPSGAPLKLAIETQSIQSVNGNATRLRYSTNSSPGSSGSPCFDIDWNLIAVHHSGDPNFDLPNPMYNEGIPVAAIKNQLANSGINLPVFAD